MQSNSALNESNSNNQPLVVSHISEPDQALKARFQSYGYLYFQGAIAAEKCQSLMLDFISLLDGDIVFDRSTKKPILIGDPFTETDAIWDKVYPKMQSLPQFHQFFHEPDAQRLMQRVAGAEVFVYPMKMARVSTPNKLGYETPPHQDAYSHHAGMTMAGMWVALHDIEQGMGRLKLLPESHKQGVRGVLEAQGVGGVQCEIFDHEQTWHVSDVKQGDVIIFHSCCVHRAEPNTTENTVRMSVDTRFCDNGAPVFISNIEPHHGWRIADLSWESIYQNWPDEVELNKLKYYWKDYSGLFSDFKGHGNVE